MKELIRLRPAGWRRRLKRFIALFAAAYVLVCLGCASWQRRMIYFPPKFDTAKTDELGAEAKLTRWTKPDGESVGWKRLAPVEPSVGSALFLHGNAGCAVWCGRYADVLQQVAALDVFIVEYPGYADRPGKPTERTLEQSADEAFKLLSADGPIYLVGESLGTGVAGYLAGAYSNQVAGVVLLAPYNSLTDVAAHHAPLLPVRLTLCDRYPTAERLRRYQGPVAMLVGGKDTVIPAEFGRRLHDAYAGPKKLWEFPDGDHGTVMDQPIETWQEVFAFLLEHRAPPQP